MQIPEEIDNMMRRLIGDSENEWKALFMASWGCANYYLKPTFQNTPLWDKPLPFSLPASKKQFHEYTPAQLYGILTSKDFEFTLGHLQTLFSLLEELATELCPIVCTGEEIRADKFDRLKKFLSGVKPYEGFVTTITKDELKELKLARESRNCFVHNNSEVDNRWLETYEEARGQKSTAKIDDRLPIEFHQIEDWHDLIVGIVRKIREAIIAKV